ncbi:hypothetical protein ASF71_14865 [Deinococcus sp. Leaf326]|nr:hypothetical protein ASF71_14865 [Deinococcus sp. Leaf326]
MKCFETTLGPTRYAAVELDDVAFIYPLTPLEGSAPMEFTPRAWLRQILPGLHLEGRELFSSLWTPEADLDMTDEQNVRSAIHLYGCPVHADPIFYAAVGAP